MIILEVNNFFSMRQQIFSLSILYLTIYSYNNHLWNNLLNYMIRQFFGIISKHDDDIFQTSQIRNGAR